MNEVSENSFQVSEGISPKERDEVAPIERSEEKSATRMTPPFGACTVKRPEAFPGGRPLFARKKTAVPEDSG